MSHGEFRIRRNKSLPDSEAKKQRHPVGAKDAGDIGKDVLDVPGAATTVNVELNCTKRRRLAKLAGLSGTSVSFGQLLLNIDPNGVVTGSGTHVNSPNVSRFDFSGTWTEGGFNLTYTATLTAGGTANGTFLMNKQ